jgi:tagatose 1,6-diphosphate aldolase
MFQFLDPGELVDGDLWLELIEHRSGDSAAEGRRGWVPAYRFALRRAGRDDRIGVIDLRIGTTENPNLFYGGHIGYRVYPEHRGHCYAARACRLVLGLARRHGLAEVWITANPENGASRRTAELAGGELVETVLLPDDNDMYRQGDRRKCRYCIAL